MSTINTKTHTVRKNSNSYDLRIWSGAFLLLVGLILIGIWIQRGMQIKDFTGIGSAEILSAEYLPNDLADHQERYRYEIRLTVAGHTKIIKETQSHREGWTAGAVLPVVFNWKDPDIYVIDTTPEAYARWIHIWGAVGLILLIGGIRLSVNGRRTRHSSSSPKGS